MWRSLAATRRIRKIASNSDGGPTQTESRSRNAPATNSFQLYAHTHTFCERMFRSEACCWQFVRSLSGTYPRSQNTHAYAPHIKTCLGEAVARRSREVNERASWSSTRVSSRDHARLAATATRAAGEMVGIRSGKRDCERKSVENVCVENFRYRLSAVAAAPESWTRSIQLSINGCERMVANNRR